MKGLVLGILLGVGIGWLTAPQHGEETRRLVGARLQELRESETAKQYLRQFSGNSSQAQENISNFTQFALRKAKVNEGMLMNLAQLAIHTMMERKFTLIELAGLTASFMKKAS